MIDLTAPLFDREADGARLGLVSTVGAAILALLVFGDVA